MGNLEYERWHGNLKRMKLDKMEALLDGYLETAATQKLSVIEILDYLIHQEYTTKEALRIEYRTNAGGFPYRKTMEQFDFDFQPSIDRMTMRELCTMKFAYNAENVIFLGPPGVGKTHLAIALGIEAIKSGFTVYYTYAHDLIQKLKRSHYENKLARKLQTLCRYKVLIIDEIGYLPLDKEGANMLFQLISRRYEKYTTILTSNKAYSEWDTIFGDSVIAAAILDRLMHHCTTINIKGQSYRLKDRRRLGGEAKA